MDMLRSSPRRIVVLLWALFVGDGLALDWPNYRGPNHDGSSDEAFRTNWSEVAPRRLWRVALDPGLSSLSIAGGRVFTMVRRTVGGEERELAVALDAADGRELWARDVDMAFYPNGGVGGDDGPRSTPTVVGDRVIVFSSYLRLHCLSATNGAVLWSRDFASEFGATVIPWQNAASPLVLGEHVLVNGNAGSERVFGVRLGDGTTAWRLANERMTHATPIKARLAGVEQAVFFTSAGLLGVEAATGRQLWRHNFALANSTSMAASPVVGGDVVYCSAAYSSGSAAFRVESSGVDQSATQVWSLRGANRNHWATPVHHGGFLYGVYGQDDLSVRCVELATGTEKWREAAPGGGPVSYGSVLKAADLLWVLRASGEMVLVRLNPDRFEEVDRFQAVEGKCWNNAALSDGKLFVRSTTQAAAYDLSVAAPAAPPVLAVGMMGAGRVRFSWPAGATGFVLERTSALTGAWADSGVTPTVDGTNRVAEVDTGGGTAGFFRLRRN
jgi:outer membrane protein assembly factor BamB